jgi:hypothetical protein
MYHGSSALVCDIHSSLFSPFVIVLPSSLQECDVLRLSIQVIFQVTPTMCCGNLAFSMLHQSQQTMTCVCTPAVLASMTTSAVARGKRSPIPSGRVVSLGGLASLVNPNLAAGPIEPPLEWEPQPLPAAAIKCPIDDGTLS